MSRRKQQEIRAVQRATGASYGSASNTHSSGGAGLGVRRGDGWPLRPKNPVVGVVIETARHVTGYSLPVALTPAICASLGIAAAAVGGDVMVTKVVAGPDGFPDVESNLVEEYEDGLDLYEVILGMDVDIELGGVPLAVAQQLVATTPGASLVYEDRKWATVALPAFPLAVTAEVRYEIESAEVAEYSVSVRDS